MTEYHEFNLRRCSITGNDTRKLSIENVCFCCLAKKEPLINLANCKHKGYLQEYCSMGYSEILVCFICHKMLKNIETFRKQVYECHRMLSFKEETVEKPSNTLMNLQISTTTITSLSEEKQIDEQKCNYIKLEKELIEDDLKTNNHTPCIIKTDVKIEYDSSNFENDVPAQNKKKKKIKLKYKKKLKMPTVEEKFNGKIKVVVLTKSELMEERESESNKESYTKQPYKCDSCIKGFDHENTYKTHVEKQHQKKGPYRCDICNSVSVSEAAYKEHGKKHFRRYECMSCGKRTTDIYSLAQHHNQQHGDTSDGIDMRFSCDKCDFKSISHSAYRYHREKHKQSQKDCKICGSTFVTTNGLRAHMNLVHKKIDCDFKCSDCDKAYKCKSRLLNHIASVHPPTDSQRFHCDQCRTRFSTKLNLIHHLRTHSAHVTEQSKKYACHECDSRFLTRTALQTHIDWEHLKAVKYKCTKCSKVLKTAVSLKRHIRFVHEKKRPPKNKICDYCGKGFTTSSILVSHIRTHTGERPLQCERCPATFAHPAALYNHNKLIHNK